MRRILIFLILALILPSFWPRIGSLASPLDALETNDGLIIKLKNSPHFKVLKLPASVSLAEAVFFLKANPLVEIVEPNYLYHEAQTPTKTVVNRGATNFFGAFFNPNDPFYTEQWYLRKIQASSAWEKVTGSTNVKVAILDTGVYFRHPDLIDNIWTNFNEVPNDGLDNDNNGYIDDFNGWDFIENDNDPSPDFKEQNATKQGINHGTIVAGVLGAMGNNERGITGVNWRVSMMPLRVLNSQGNGSTATVERAIRYAINQGVDIINLSFVGSGYSELLYRTILEAYNKGILVVAASGNDPAKVQDLDHHPLYPVCFVGPQGENMILGVAASNGLDERAAFSSVGTTCIDITAPGTGFFSTTGYDAASPDALREYYSDGWSGTSVAAPLVSGVAALAKALDKNLIAQDLISLIRKNSDNIYDKNPALEGKMGQGRLNAFSVVQAVIEKMRADANGFLRKGSLVLSAGSGEKPYVKIFDLDGTSLRETGKILALPSEFRSGITTSIGDFNGDSFPELVTAPLGRGGSQVRLWKSNGEPIRSFFAFDKSFNNGLRAATVNLDGSANNLLVIGSPAGASEIRVYTAEGILFNRFTPFSNASYPISVAVGDLDRDGIDEIIAIPRTGPPEVRIFNAAGALLKEFKAFPYKTAGTQIVIADMNNDGWKEIAAITTAGNLEIRLFNFDGRLLTPAIRLAKINRAGAHVAGAGDINNDGNEEILIHSSVAPNILWGINKEGKVLAEINLGKANLRSIGSINWVK